MLVRNATQGKIVIQGTKDNFAPLMRSDRVAIIPVRRMGPSENETYLYLERVPKDYKPKPGESASLFSGAKTWTLTGMVNRLGLTLKAGGIQTKPDRSRSSSSRVVIPLGLTALVGPHKAPEVAPSEPSTVMAEAFKKAGITVQDLQEVKSSCEPKQKRTAPKNEISTKQAVQHINKGVRNGTLQTTRHKDGTITVRATIIQEYN